MTEWWTYRLHDFLMFSPRVYSRTHELYNETIWPLNALAMSIAWALLFIVVKSGLGATNRTKSTSDDSVTRRVLRVCVFAYFAAAHAWIAIVFLRVHYAPIFWAAEYFAYAFVTQSVLLVIAAAVATASSEAFHFTRSTVHILFGIVLVSLALAVYPVISIATGKAFSSIEAVGVTPDVTAIAMLGFLLQIQPADGVTGDARLARYVWYAIVALALGWCVVSLLTHLAMGSNTAFVPGIALTGWVASAFLRRHFS